MLRACAGSLLLAATAQAQASAHYTVGTLRVRGGNPVAGETGLLYSAAFDSTCQLQPEELASPALSTSLHAPGPAVLDVEAIGCPAAGPPPRLDCTLDVGGATTSSPPGFRGWHLTLPVPTPATTGIYKPKLRCEVESTPFASSPGTLYLTYAPPLPSVSVVPPARDWYQRACTWGAGLSAGAGEEEVVQTLLNGLYAYGQAHWRYGYCQISPDGKTCTFGTTSITLTDPPDPRFDCYPAPYNLCKCTWTTLVQSAGAEPLYNFADCFVFSDTLQYVNATMGVGGIAQEQVTGQFWLGFSSLPTTRSIDPAFAGNSQCGYRQLPCSYAFHNHDLERRGPLIFDPTFGKVYHDLGELVGESVVAQDGFDLRFPGRSACFERFGYGLFRFYTDAPACLPGKDGASFVRQPVVTPVVVPAAEGKGLAVDLTVAIHVPGEYTVTGGIYGGKEGTTPLALRPFDRTAGLLSMATVADAPSHQATARLLFSGEDLASAPPSGPLVLRATLVGPQGVVDRLTARLDLTGISLAELGERPARFGDPAAIRVEIAPGEPGRPRALAVRVPVTVRRSGTLVLEGRLARGNATVAYAGGPVELGQGPTQELRLDFPLAASDEGSGPFELTLGLSQPSPTRFVDALRATVTPAPPSGGPSRP